MMTPEEQSFENELHPDIPINEQDDEAVAVEGGPDRHESPDGESLSKAVYSWAADLVGCLVFVVLFFIFIVRIIGVDGSSMVPTLHDRDMVLLLSNVLYEPERGDVVVITKESYNKPIVKRIIAVEGQTVDIDFDNCQVYVDGVLQNEPYINEPTAVQGDIQFPLTVPEGCLFVMGDNRNHSTDSRFSIIGIVDQRSVLGKVMFRIFPFTNIGKIA